LWQNGDFVPQKKITDLPWPKNLDKRENSTPNFFKKNQ
jgi:hypothetical protein